MSNSYYNHTSPLAARTKARSSTVNDELDAIAAGFAAAEADINAAIVTTNAVSVTTTYTVSSAYNGYTFICNPTGGAFVVTIPDADTVSAGHRIRLVLKTTAGATLNKVTITDTSVAVVWALVMPNDAIELQSDGTLWQTVMDTRALFFHGTATGQSISDNSTATALELSPTIDLLDSNSATGAHNVATPTRINCPQLYAGRHFGLVIVRGFVEFTSNATGLRGVAIKVGGSLSYETYVPALNGKATTVPFHYEYYDPSPSTYFEICPYQNSGGALSTTGSEKIWTHYY